ncbi:MAG: phosphate signaling complex protein PhoU [Oscillospiraceae bacterium]|nr:phosphate signaling complex protein PhoU [Oscillospiraceae bacterium]
MRTKFDEQLDTLNSSLVEMGKVVEAAISDANKALVNRDTDLAKKIIAGDDVIDDMEKEIERLCLKIILRQQPVAGDLRLVSAVMKIITDLERIGDHASDISELAIFMAETGQPYIKKLEHIPQMSEETNYMLNRSIESFVKKDIDMAKRVIAKDDVVDDLFVQIKTELVDLMKKDTNNTDQAVDFIMIAKYFERIGDHAVNIAEWVVFSLTGVHKDSKVM